MAFTLSVVVSALVISFASWRSGRFPPAAGFIVALPLDTMLVLPLCLTFFLPFLLAGRLALSFWEAYALGCLALPVGLLVHRVVMKALFT